jgi:hypothetical protein
METKTIPTWTEILFVDTIELQISKPDAKTDGVLSLHIQHIAVGVGVGGRYPFLQVSSVRKLKSRSYTTTDEK